MFPYILFLLIMKFIHRNKTKLKIGVIHLLYCILDKVNTNIKAAAHETVRPDWPDWLLMTNRCVWMCVGYLGLTRGVCAV